MISIIDGKKEKRNLIMLYMEKKENKLGGRLWASFILIGLVGQLAWCLENNYINLWIYSQTNTTDGITAMTVASALAATLTAFFMGALSDKLGIRKKLIAGGYIVWGLSVAAFALFSYQNMFALTQDAAQAIFLVCLFMTIADVVMTYFGSTANDAAFNSFVTDNTNEENRGKVESFLSVLPLVANIAMLFVSGLFGATSYLKDEPHNGRDILAQNWMWFFLVMGIIVLVVGIISIWLLPKDVCVPNRESYLKQLAHGFLPSTIKSHKRLYVALIAFACFNSAINSFMPYYMVYFQQEIGTGIEFYVAMGIILLVASLVAIILGIFMDRIGRMKLLLPAMIVGAIGSLGLFFLKDMMGLIIFATLLMSGYLVSTAILGAEIRDETPKNKVGLFQGVRMVFVVLIPMVTGPLISQAFFPTGAIDPINPSLTGKTPNESMFMVAFIFFLVAIIPVLLLTFRFRKSTEGKPHEENSDSHPQ